MAAAAETPALSPAVPDVGPGSLSQWALIARELKPLRPHAQRVFQDPYSSLNPRLNVRDIVGEPLVIHRFARGAELDDRVSDMLRRVGLDPALRGR